MKSLLISTLAALSLCACATPAAPAAHASPAALSTAPRSGRRERVKRILAENVRLFVYEGSEARRTASGVVVASEEGPEGPSSWILTNAHVVDPTGLKDPRFAAVVDQPDADPLEYRCDVIAVGKVPEMDLALVRLWGAALERAPLADDSELIPGDTVIVAGAVFGKPLSLSGGLISQIELDRRSHAPRMLKTDAPIGYGASGGGVFSLDSGHLLAIVEGYRTAKVGFEVGDHGYSFDVPMPGETFAAPTAKVRTFLESKGYARLLKAPSPASDTSARR